MNEERSLVRKAVALKYEMGKDEVPRVIAKGERLLAEKIISIAQEKGIYIYEDPTLVALLGRLEVGSEIPETLYRAVAEILVFVFRLEGKV
ncbi:MAG: EscU/YscU/HrcU family type III secretion system export apparatus switch protein [Candidatus Hydrogenedentes bacterium]|nr:EscU/YscU/HrcU family type III secretion system export apparatus switch protein [Candidatus Hydrogenedentota bacterium]